MAYVQKRKLFEGRVFRKPNCPKFPNYVMDSAHDMIIVKSHLLNFLRAEFVRIFTECSEVSEVSKVSEVWIEHTTW